MNNFRNQLIEEMELLYQLMTESNDPVQVDSIVKMLVQLVKYVDLRKHA